MSATTTARLPARDLARAWLSTAQASAKDDVPALNKTLCVEQHPDGLRLVATDRYVLLTSWIDEHGDHDIPPGIDEAPERTVIAADPDGRAKNLAAYIAQLTSDEDDPDWVGVPLHAEVTFDVRLPYGADQGEMQLDGLDPTYVVLSVPDVESVYLQVVEADYPDWRKQVAGFAAQTTEAIALNAEITERLSKLRKWHPGSPLVWRFGGSERVAEIELGGSTPRVSGLVMPMRWQLPEEDGTNA